MSPRIQVYKAIACRSTSTDSGLDLASLAKGLIECGGPEVEAKSAKIQAGTLSTLLERFRATGLTAL